MTKHLATLGGMALGLALTVTSCTDGGTDPQVQEDTPSASATEPSTATPTPSTPEEEAGDALTRYLDVRDDSYRAAAIELKLLNKVATGDVFLQIQAQVADLDQYDIKVTGQYVHTLGEPRRRSDSMFFLTDCEDRSGVSERNKDGERIKHKDPNGDPLRNPVPVEYTLVLDKGAWKVSDSDMKWDRPC